MMAKDLGGRPSVMTESTLEKLERAFAVGATDTEACFFADIHPATLYNYQKEHPEFLDRKNALKQKPVLKARTVVANALEKNDKDVAKWVLERKDPDYNPRAKIDHTSSDKSMGPQQNHADIALGLLTQEQLEKLRERIALPDALGGDSINQQE